MWRLFGKELDTGSCPDVLVCQRLCEQREEHLPETKSGVESLSFLVSHTSSKYDIILGNHGDAFLQTHTGCKTLRFRECLHGPIDSNESWEHSPARCR